MFIYRVKSTPNRPHYSDSVRILWKERRTKTKKFYSNDWSPLTPLINKVMKLVAIPCHMTTTNSNTTNYTARMKTVIQYYRGYTWNLGLRPWYFCNICQVKWVTVGQTLSLLENVRSEYDHRLKQTAYATPVTFYYGKWWKVYKAWKCNGANGNWFSW